jgi:chemotaxis protein MotB
VAKKKRHHAEEPENGERWLLTYADLITLLLGLFVILYAMSQVDKTKYQDFISALTRQFGSTVVLAGHKGITFTPAPKRGRAQSLKAGESKAQGRQGRITTQLSALLKHEIAAGEVVIKPTSEGISINLLDFLLFETGKANIRPEALVTLNKISAYLDSIPNKLRVEGHTDNVPINTFQFPSNWHLSVARSMNTGYYIIQRGIPPERLSIAGYSEYRPVADNDTPENRSKNRRVEIVILNESATATRIVDMSDSLSVNSSN